MGGWFTIPTPTYNQHGAMVEQQMTFITEPNLYKCIFQSRKKEAEAFQDWVCSEVLPSIRKNGGYMVARQDDDEKGVKNVYTPGGNQQAWMLTENSNRFLFA